MLVRQPTWLDSLSDSDFKRVDEICGSLKRRVLAALEPLITSRQLGKVGNYGQRAI